MKGSIRILLGLVILMGVAGSDCDGKCMENAMPLTEMLIYGIIGLGLFASGTFAAIRQGEING